MNVQIVRAGQAQENDESIALLKQTNPEQRAIAAKSVVRTKLAAVMMQNYPHLGGEFLLSQLDQMVERMGIGQFNKLTYLKAVENIVYNEISVFCLTMGSNAMNVYPSKVAENMFNELRPSLHHAMIIVNHE